MQQPKERPAVNRQRFRELCQKHTVVFSRHESALAVVGKTVDERPEVSRRLEAPFQEVSGLIRANNLVEGRRHVVEVVPEASEKAACQLRVTQKLEHCLLRKVSSTLANHPREIPDCEIDLW